MKSRWILPTVSWCDRVLVAIPMAHSLTPSWNSGGVPSERRVSVRSPTPNTRNHGGRVNLKLKGKIQGWKKDVEFKEIGSLRIDEPSVSPNIHPNVCILLCAWNGMSVVNTIKSAKTPTGKRRATALSNRFCCANRGLWIRRTASHSKVGCSSVSSSNICRRDRQAQNPALRRSVRVTEYQSSGFGGLHGGIGDGEMSG